MISATVVDEADYDLGYTSIDVRNKYMSRTLGCGGRLLFGGHPSIFPVGLGRGRRVNIDPVH